MVKNSQKAKKTSVTSERVPISSKPSNLDCRDSGESFDAHIVAVCKIFEKGRGFCRAPCLAVGLLYTCILQGARQVQGPCCGASCGRASLNIQDLLDFKYTLYETLLLPGASRTPAARSGSGREGGILGIRYRS